MGWARLLKRVFALDLEHCPQCGGEFKIIAAIEEPAVIVRILTHLGLPARRRAHRHGRCLCSRQPDTAGKNGCATGTVRWGLRSPVAVKVRRNQPRGADAATDKPARAGGFFTQRRAMYRSPGLAIQWRVQERRFEFPMHRRHSRGSLYQGSFARIEPV
jgi:hypothetical protein